MVRSLPRRHARLASRPIIAPIAGLLALLLGGAPAHAVDAAASDEVSTAAREESLDESLETALSTLGTSPARLRLIDGSMAIGRIVRFDQDQVTIRRPSGGLRSLPFEDVARLTFKAADGSLLPGRLVRLASGDLGWLAEDMPDEVAVAENAAIGTGDGSESGGPLIRLDGDRAKPGDDEIAELQPIISTLASLAPAVPASEDVLAASDSPVRLTVTADEAREDDGRLQFRLTLSAPSERPVLILYSLVDGSASAPGDYGHRQGTVVFQPGETEALVTTDLIDDDIAEGVENVQFFVSGDPALVTIETRSILADIADDDG